MERVSRERKKTRVEGENAVQTRNNKKTYKNHTHQKTQETKNFLSMHAYVVCNRACRLNYLRAYLFCFLLAYFTNKYLSRIFIIFTIVNIINTVTCFKKPHWEQTTRWRWWENTFTPHHHHQSDNKYFAHRALCFITRYVCYALILKVYKLLHSIPAI